MMTMSKRLCAYNGVSDCNQYIYENTTYKITKIDGVTVFMTCKVTSALIPCVSWAVYTLFALESSMLIGSAYRTV